MPRDQADWAPAVDGATVGVLAYPSTAGRPVACAVTPYVDRGQLVVTSTLAFPAKAVAVHRAGAAAVLAGGFLLRGRVDVAVDRIGTEFDRWVRPQELRKYPPARSLLAIPGHRRLFPWYVRRIYLRFVDPSMVPVGLGDDATTLVTLDADGLPVILAAPPPPAAGAEGWTFQTGRATPDGPACVLVHHETDGMAELRQLRVDGSIAAGRFTGARIVGSLAPQPTGWRADIARLRHLARQARASRPLIDTLPALPARPLTRERDHA